MIAVLAPSCLLVAPQKANALDAVFETNAQLLWSEFKTALETTYSTIKLGLIDISAATSALAEKALVFNAYVLQPLAFIMSGNLLKALTAGVIKFVVGATNGTGVPQFVQNIQGHLQNLGDARAMAFFVQFGRNSNSPFAAAISSSLRTNYLQNTSMAGFWAANRSTLARYSPNPNAFLAGNWSQGGIPAWFALTTQRQNNPYLLYYRSQSQLSNLVVNATAARLNELAWGNGFLSWCGSSDELKVDTVISETDDESVGDTTPLTTASDSCYKSDGSSGVIKTPGGTIKATLDKVLGSNQDKLVQLGQLANQVGTILSNVSTVMNTVNFATQLLGGDSSGGLAGANKATAGNRSLLYTYQNTPGYLGITTQSVAQDATTVTNLNSDISKRLDQYETAWATIRGAAVSASTTVGSLATFCDAAATQQLNNENASSFVVTARDEANIARTAIVTYIAPVLARADAAAVEISSARAQILKVQANLSTTSTQYIGDLQTLNSMPPTTSQISQALQDATSLGGATASPPGSLNVSGGSLTDQMGLMSTNAEALKTSVCTYTPSSRNSGSSDG
jgi:hypothetical protein